MTLPRAPIFLFLITIACTSKPSNEQKYPSKGSLLVFDSAYGNYAVSAEDKKLISTWEAFKEAVSSSDFFTLERLSFDSIICENCVPIKASPLIAVDSFYREHGINLFSKSFSTLLLDSSKVRCSYDLDSSYFNAYPSLSTISDIENPKLAVMLVSYPNTNSQGEHNSGLLGFLETNSGYKFFGYSTIP